MSDGPRSPQDAGKRIDHGAELDARMARVDASKQRGRVLGLFSRGKNEGAQIGQQITDQARQELGTVLDRASDRQREILGQRVQESTARAQEAMADLFGSRQEVRNEAGAQNTAPVETDEARAARLRAQVTVSEIESYKKARARGWIDPDPEMDAEIARKEGSASAVVPQPTLTKEAAVVADPEPAVVKPVQEDPQSGDPAYDRAVARGWIPRDEQYEQSLTRQASAGGTPPPPVDPPQRFETSDAPRPRIQVQPPEEDELPFWFKNLSSSSEDSGAVTGATIPDLSGDLPSGGEGLRPASINPIPEAVIPTDEPRAAEVAVESRDPNALAAEPILTEPAAVGELRTEPPLTRDSSTTAASTESRPDDPRKPYRDMAIRGIDEWLRSAKQLQELGRPVRIPRAKREALVSGFITNLIEGRMDSRNGKVTDFLGSLDADDKGFFLETLGKRLGYNTDADRNSDWFKGWDKLAHPEASKSGIEQSIAEGHKLVEDRDLNAGAETVKTEAQPAEATTIPNQEASTTSAGVETPTAPASEFDPLALARMTHEQFLEFQGRYNKYDSEYDPSLGGIEKYDELYQARAKGQLMLMIDQVDQKAKEKGVSKATYQELGLGDPDKRQYFGREIELAIENSKIMPNDPVIERLKEVVSPDDWADIVYGLRSKINRRKQDLEDIENGLEKFVMNKEPLDEREKAWDVQLDHYINEIVQENMPANREDWENFANMAEEVATENSIKLDSELISRNWKGEKWTKFDIKDTRVQLSYDLMRTRFTPDAEAVQKWFNSITPREQLEFKRVMDQRIGEMLKTNALLPRDKEFAVAWIGYIYPGYTEELDKINALPTVSSPS